MLNADDIKLKIETLEAEATKIGGLDGARYREMAMQWRFLNIEAAFMDAIKANLAQNATG